MAIGNASGVRTEAIITAMESPLGRAVGNALEVIECIEVLKGRGPRDLIDVSGRADGADARARRASRTICRRPSLQVQRAIASGAGLERFRQIIEIQGGDPTRRRRLPAAAARRRRGTS